MQVRLSLTRSVRFLFLTGLLVAACLLSAQDTRRKLLLPAEERDQDQPAQRAKWNMRGREVSKGESAAGLRLRAHQQKMAMRAQRIAAAQSQAAVLGGVPQGWKPLGPAPLASDATGSGGQDYNWVSGRATSVLVDPADATGNTVLVGGAYGGLWKSTNAATANSSQVVWQSLIDDQPSLAVGAIAVQPGNSNLILVGTGETNSSGDSYYGMGILRSTNGGATWTQIQTAASGQSFLGIGFSKIAFSTTNANLVVATTAGNLGLSFGLEQDANSTARGIYYSIDAGATWNRVILSDSAIPASATGLIYNAGQGAFYAAIRRHGIYSSTDGQHFTRLATQPTPGLTTTNCPANSNSSNCPLYRAEFAVTPGRNEMYVWVYDLANSEIDDGIWRTVNGGTAWAQIPDNGITTCGDGAGNGCGVQQGFYNLELAAVPKSSGTNLYAGTINIYKCTIASNAQTSCTQGDWINLTHVYGCSPLGALAHVHPDQHGMSFAGSALPGYFAHDGGISRTLNEDTGLNTGTCSGSNSFASLSETLGSMTEFVSFSVHPTSPDIMLGGTQDNGSPKTSTGTTGLTWQNSLGGDGGFTSINPNPGNGGNGIAGDEWFTSNPNSVIWVCENGTSCDDTTQILDAIPGFPNSGNIDQGPFYTPFILDPQNTNEMLIGTCRIWRGDTLTSVFNPLSNNFDTGTTTLCNGGEINQVAALAAGGPKDANGFSNVVYATTSGLGPFFTGQPGGEVWATTNASTTMLSNKTGTINSKHYAISGVAIDTSVASGQTAYVGVTGFHTQHVWKTTTAGGSWTDWSGTGASALPDAPVSAVFVDPTASLVYAGTDVGVFSSPTTGSGGVWTEVGPTSGTGFLPSAPVTAIQMFTDTTQKRLRVSTYGRGIWEFDISTDFSLPGTLTNPPNASPGQTTQASMTVTPVGGTFGSSVTFACSGLPAGSTCTFSPTQLSAGASATTVNITVTTKGPFTGVAGGPKPARRAQNHLPWLPLSLPLAGLLLVGLSGRRLSRRGKVTGLCLALVLLAFLVACGGGGSSTPPPPPPVSVTVSPTSLNTLYPNLTGAPPQTQTFTATVHNDTNQSVSWQVNGVDGGNATFGTIDATGNYTAPVTLPSPANFNVTAIAQADTTKTGNSIVTIQTPTASGDYPITVTATSGATSHTTLFHLIVN
jgi:hypothetical protein